MNKNRLIILSGPSCVGKTPLFKVFNKQYPELALNLQKIVLYNSRWPRPSEKNGVDYHFRKRKEIEKLSQIENFIVMEVRGDLQALDINELKQQMEKSNIFFEGNTYIAKILLRHPPLNKMNKLSIFLSPLSKDEIIKLRSTLGTKEIQKYVFETMKNKLIGRAKKFKQELTEEVLENINKRAQDAYTELKDAWMFDYIIPNHDGEDSDNWDDPISFDSEAYLAVQELSILLKNEKQQISEKWERDLLV